MHIAHTGIRENIATATAAQSTDVIAQVGIDRHRFGKMLHNGQVVQHMETDPLWREVSAIARRVDPRGVCNTEQWLPGASSLYATAMGAHLLLGVVVVRADRMAVAMREYLPVGHLEATDSSLSDAVSRIAMTELGLTACLSGWQGLSVERCECERAQQHVVLIAEATAWGSTKLHGEARWRPVATPLRPAMR